LQSFHAVVADAVAAVDVRVNLDEVRVGVVHVHVHLVEEVVVVVLQHILLPASLHVTDHLLVEDLDLDNLHVGGEEPSDVNVTVKRVAESHLVQKHSGPVLNEEVLTGRVSDVQLMDVSNGIEILPPVVSEDAVAHQVMHVHGVPDNNILACV
ncbi:unnamed protein product, partial [Plutella xylostella]